MSATLRHLVRALSALSIAGLLCACPWSAYAEEEALATDRPDFVESSDVVGKGRFQIETSLAFEHGTVDGTRYWLRSTPTLLRIGLSDRLEARLETEGALYLRSTDENGLTTRTRGHADLSIGLKWHVQDGDEASGRPGIGWLLHVDTDSGSREFRGEGLRPSLRVVAEWELPHGFSLGVMPGLFVEHNEEGRSYVGGIAAAVLGKSLTDKLRGFVELSGQQLTSSHNGGNVITGDVGLAYLLSNSVQVDTAASWGLSKAAADFGWTVGLSLRF